MELRKDYILDRWVIISEERAKRPDDFKEKEKEESVNCIFCPGNEEQTPPEIFRIGKQRWQIRVVPNKYAAVELKGDSKIQTHSNYYTFASAYGIHEVVIETPEHQKKFGKFSNDEIMQVIKVYSSRISELHKNPSIKYVSVFKNQGEKAAASREHTHSQIIAMSVIPPVIKEKIESIKKYSYCSYCDIINREKNSYRRCFENENCVAFAPYASRFNYEIWIFPKKHVLSFKDFNESMYKDFASILKSIVQKLERIGADYNICWFYSPEGENLHFHVEVMPRTSVWAGFEFGTGIIINKISPENAAKFYRGENESNF